MKRYCVPAAAWFLLALGTAKPVLAASESGTTIRTLHVNDLHGWLLPGSAEGEDAPAGGFAALAAAGGDGCRVFSGKKPVFGDEGTFIREAVASWWRERGAVPPMPAGRITVAE